MSGNVYIPDVVAAKVTDIDPAELGVKGILIDLDNTLLPWKDSVVSEEVRQWAAKVMAGGVGICLVSNTHNPRRLRKIAADMGVESIYSAWKPLRGGFKRGADILGCKLEECAAVGDQLMTDIKGGNRAGCLTVLVRPVDKKEFWGTKISRFFERRIMKKSGIEYK
ncbi:MAG: YqeG family HAD IIIA-type phosphatase [Abditibacteriota bacterium]|nr:YqeG family HAD IIIA-type phosphatase [Abditibacteriota bacterium]